MSYDVFISYRRKGSGAGVAGEMQSKLESRGYKVFLDVDNIGSGDFPDQIDHAIQQCNDFLLILSPGMLDRCVEEEDWVRHEIVLAEKYNKNIVGVSLPGFVMPTAEELPAELHSIPEKQVFLWSHEYRHASFEKIVENLKSTALKKKRNKRNYSWIGLLVVVLAVGGWWLLQSRDEPQPEEPEPIVTENKKEVADYQLFTNAVNDTFASYLEKADSLLQLVPENPTRKQDFELFMAGIGEVDAALDFQKKFPGVVTSVPRVEKMLDSLMRLRKNRLDWELNAASSFFDLDIDVYRTRFENAQILALPEDSKAMEKIGKKLSK